MTVPGKNEIMKILESLNIRFVKGTSTAKLNNTLKSKLQKDHQIHQQLKALDILHLYLCLKLEVIS